MATLTEHSIYSLHEIGRELLKAEKKLDGKVAHKGRQRRGASGGQVDRNQIWPEAMAMGSLADKNFAQMFGARCKQGVNSDDGLGQSFLAFDFDRELLVMRSVFDAPDEALPPAFRPFDAELSFDDITSHGIHVWQQPKGTVLGRKMERLVITVSCRRPPKFYTQFDPKEKHMAKNRRRATAADFINPRTLTAEIISAIPRGPCAHPTFWNTYRWEFSLDEKQSRLFVACADNLRLVGQTSQTKLLSDKSHRWETQLLQSTRVLSSYESPSLDGLAFAPRALLEGLVGQGILRPIDVVDMLVALRKHAVVPAFQERLLESLYSEERIRSPEAVVAARAHQLRKYEVRNVDHVVMVRTVQVTPTRLLVGPPQQEPSNSVTRRYRDKLDAIIRVQFTDESDRIHVLDYAKRHDKKDNTVGLMARVRRALQYGVEVGGQRFYPVASSASQQKWVASLAPTYSRDHAIWYINTSIIDGSELRKWMGSVEEKVVAKHAARMGLPFSASRMVDIKVRHGPRLPDIERGGFCFTDGCAVAGSGVIAEAARALGHVNGLNATPSAIQFRLGGAKGVLACWPQLVGSDEIRLRPSQIKFESQLVDLNVVRIAKYQTAFLNRQFIMIMSALGIPDGLFIKLFEEAISGTKGLSERVRDGRLKPTDKDLLSLCATNELPLVNIIAAGFSRDPLVLDLCRLIECRALQDLKWRSRLKLKDGVFLIGIADETGTLAEGEVYCQYQVDDRHLPSTVTGKVVICRAPALHPGDVRHAHAVDRPRLRHLKNVIVFSVNGARPLANMQVSGIDLMQGSGLTVRLGGGDLDGDDFTLIWDGRFVKPLSVVPAMDYTGPKPVKERVVTQKHLNENFVQYMLNDVLGQVDNTHLALADKYDEGPFHPDCLQLAEVHSVSDSITLSSRFVAVTYQQKAVDFAKTGVAAELDPELVPKEWPDFMDKPKRYTYASQKVLGQIFRLVDAEPHFISTDLEDAHYPVDKRFDRFPTYPKILDLLQPVKSAFETAILYSMRRFKVQETELVAGFPAQSKRRKGSRDLNNLADSYCCHVLAARAAVLQIMDAIDLPASKLTKAQVAARHCYALTYEEKHVKRWQAEIVGEHRGDLLDEEDRLSLLPRPMMSFAWVFHAELIELVAM